MEAIPTFSANFPQTESFGGTIAYQVGSVPPADCGSGTTEGFWFNISGGPVAMDNSKYLNLNGLVDATTYSARLCVTSNRYINSSSGSVLTITHSPSLTLTFTTGSSGLIAPTNVVATSLSDNEVHISWDPVPGATSYTISQESSCTSTAQITNSNEINFAGLNSGSSYTFKICARNTTGISSESNSNSVFTDIAPGMVISKKLEVPSMVSQSWQLALPLSEILTPTVWMILSH